MFKTYKFKVGFLYKVISLSPEAIDEYGKQFYIIPLSAELIAASYVKCLYKNEIIKICATRNSMYGHFSYELADKQ